MSGDCNGEINQENGGLRVEFDLPQCKECKEEGCFGKIAANSAGAETVPNTTTEAEALKVQAIELLLNKFNGLSKTFVDRIMQGKVDGFMIIGSQGQIVFDAGYMSKRQRAKALTTIVERDFQAMIKEPDFNRLGAMFGTIISSLLK